MHSHADADEIARALTLPGDRKSITTDAAAREALGRAGVLHVVGAEGAAPALLARALLLRSERPLLYVAPDLATARRAAADLEMMVRGLPFPSPRDAPLGDGRPPLLLAPSEVSPYAEVHPDRRTTLGRLATLFRLASGSSWRVLVTTAPALVRRVVPREAVLAGSERVAVDTEVDVERLARRLSDAGYLRVPLVEDPGTFTIRGGILDVWAPGAEQPVRAELYGDLVLGLRAFDPETQRTVEDLAEVSLPPARDAILTPEVRERARARMRSLCDAVNLPTTKTRLLVDDVGNGKTFFGIEGYAPAYYDLEPLWSYLPAETAMMVEAPARVRRAIDEELDCARDGEAARSGTPHFPVSRLYTSAEDLAREIQRRPVVAAHTVGVAGANAGSLDALETVPVDAPTLAIRDHADLQRAVGTARSSRGKEGTLDPLVERLSAWADAGLAVAITARGSTQAERVATLLAHRGIEVSPGPAAEGSVAVVVGPLSRGAIAPAEGFVLVTEEEIFGQRAHRQQERRRSTRALLEDLRALVPGDHVVHVEHGIGRYQGLERKTIGGVSVDLLVVEYAGGRLFLPVHRLNQVQKYSGGDGTPRLDRLGGQTFARTKAKVRRRVREMADELLSLYAERSALTKEPLPPPDDEYAALEATFPFEETRDQAAAIVDVMQDLESDRVMDRLVCGDVGFGKTEVALRAAFRNALAGRQTAVLCPTTVLAQQHYLTFARRLQGHPIEIRVMSRFQSRGEQDDAVRGLKSGTVDIVIGTHRLLSKDVHFKNLGLLVIDEEQRFGVAHKERIKQLKSSVDVLTLTATPIPRTLQLAVGGLRDMSVITTPPVDRRAIRTIVSQHDARLLREAITRELARGGQVFYVYNRVETLYERAAALQSVVPEARVAVAHGQLKEATLERTMLDFVDGKYDVLVATAIIESGLDIPRANTIIIDRADLFGLAQLYQLRGRVGRSSERAYCYLLVPPPSRMTDEARSRVEALERYSDLGTGFHIATLDMELRGTGDLLGADQSGFVASVGFDLFCQMLEEATHELRGEPLVHEVDPELTVDVDALLPEGYVPEVGVRLSLYKRLASAHDEAEVSALSSEMEDRFGAPPTEARGLVHLMRLKTELRRLKALGCEATARTMTLHLRDDTPLDPAKIGKLVAGKRSQYRLSPDMRLSRRAAADEVLPDGIAHADRMLSELASCLRD